MNRSIFVSSLLALGIAAPLAAVGCAAPTEEPAADEEKLAETQDELTAAASRLVGSYWTHAVTFGGFGRLNLKANGKYDAQVDPAGTAVCITSPCLLPESGTWNATKIAGGYRLRIRAAGHASRYYVAVESGSTLKLTGNGAPQTLNELGPKECLDSADCSASEECGPKLCMMWCAAGDPFCCGTATCQPKAPVTCGTSTCAAGQVCCNPLSGICTNPGEFCAM